MAYSAQTMRQARQRYQAQQREREQEADRQRQAAYAAEPRLRALDLRLRTTVAQVMASAFEKRSDPEQALRQAREANLAAQAERTALLEGLNMPDYLDTDARCSRCGGTGWQGQQLCGCLRAQCRQVQMDQLASLPGKNEPGFDSFRLDVYETRMEEKLQISPREQMRQVLARCQDWAARFGPGSPSLLLCGGTGLGKTLLSACLARTLTMQDVGVVYTRVSAMLREYENAQFGGAERPRAYEETQLLIIDDLGTEMSTQFTNSVLYSVLDSRLLEGHPTVISTNLSSATLQQRYPPQLISRLLGQYELLIFFGRDLRME